jgi:hypothetical protein
MAFERRVVPSSWPRSRSDHRGFDSLRRRASFGGWLQISGRCGSARRIRTVGDRGNADECGRRGLGSEASRLPTHNPQGPRSSSRPPARTRGTGRASAPRTSFRERCTRGTGEAQTWSAWTSVRSHGGPSSDSVTPVSDSAPRIGEVAVHPGSRTPKSQIAGEWHSAGRTPHPKSRLRLLRARSSSTHDALPTWQSYRVDGDRRRGPRPSGPYQTPEEVGEADREG